MLGHVHVSGPCQQISSVAMVAPYLDVPTLNLVTSIFLLVVEVCASSGSIHSCQGWFSSMLPPNPPDRKGVLLHKSRACGSENKCILL